MKIEEIFDDKIRELVRVFGEDSGAYLMRLNSSREPIYVIGDKEYLENIMIKSQGSGLVGPIR